jgi:hypothetical protein
MTDNWFSFYWHGHRRGSLKFTVLYDPNNNHTVYDSISTSHLEYLQSISKEHVPRYRFLSSNENSKKPNTLREIVCAIFKEDEAILDSYERYCRFFENKNDLVDFAFSEFEWIGEQSYLDAIMDMTFEEKIKYDNS